MNDAIPSSALIDLRSDTVTRPTAAMRAMMLEAPTGDDVFAEDPTMNALEERVAEMWGHEAGLFFPSGTMANQAAIQVHTRPGDEVICGALSHIYHYEGGGIARNSGASVRLVGESNGTFTADQIQSAINPPDSHYARTGLVSVEDTVNKGGGAVWSLDELEAIRTTCSERGLPLHLDGARVWNAQVARGVASTDLTSWRAYGRRFDSISVCFSKGLGCPVGSMLVGSREFIREAHRSRKVLGGGMRQVGILAAACLHALDHHIDRMADDHQAARALGNAAAQHPDVDRVAPVETNIVIFTLRDGLLAQDFVDDVAKHGLLCFPFGPNAVRLVTHLDVDHEAIHRAVEIIGAWHPSSAQSTT